MHLCGQIPRKKGALEIAAIPGFLATVTYHEKYNMTSWGFIKKALMCLLCDKNEQLFGSVSFNFRIFEDEF